MKTFYGIACGILVALAFVAAVYAGWKVGPQ